MKARMVNDNLRKLPKRRQEKKKRERNFESERIDTFEIAIAEALDGSRRRHGMESKLWTFNTFVSPSEDFDVVQQVIFERKQREEREKKNQASEQERLVQRKDYLVFVQLVNRYGPCPGYLYCTSNRPGSAYSDYLSENATDLVLWWRRYLVSKRVNLRLMEAAREPIVVDSR